LKPSDHAARQQRFYDTRRHEHLQADAGDLYATNLARRLAEVAGIGAHHRVLELGAGFGRFTFPLLERCGSVTALDLSARALETLDSTRAARGIPAERCRTHAGDLERVEPRELGEPFDFVVGFFLLHHLADIARALQHARRFAAPGGVLVFLEPNRLNPLFLAQVAICPDMTWREERGMFRLSPRGVRTALRGAGLDCLDTERFGFFPPQVVNRLPAAQVLETRLERVSWLRGVLPFLILGGRVPVQGP